MKNLNSKRKRKPTSSDLISATASATLKKQKAHQDLAAAAQMVGTSPRADLDYEPLLAAHPVGPIRTSFLGKTCAPLWIGPLTGGPAGKLVNTRLAQVAQQYRLGWMLGSMRSLLTKMRTSSLTAGDALYQWRPIVGDIPLWANLGIAQLEQIVQQQDYALLDEALHFMAVDGLAVHINPWQEWWQPEGDRITEIPLKTLEKFLAQTRWPIIVKEVGQGWGPRSLAALLELPLAAIDLAGWGGTNFTRLEALRSGRPDFGLAQIGRNCCAMAEQICARPLGPVKNFILSGGQEDLAGSMRAYQQLKAIGANSVVALAYPLLRAALAGEDDLQKWVGDWLHAWAAAEAYVHRRGHDG